MNKQEATELISAHLNRYYVYTIYLAGKPVYVGKGPITGSKNIGAIRRKLKSQIEDGTTYCQGTENPLHTV